MNIKTNDKPFHQNEQFKPRNEKEKMLCKAFLEMKNEKQVANLLRDLMTLPEIEVFANRIEIVRLLKQGYSYTKIAKETNVSTTTVTRTAYWLHHGCGGYAQILDLLLKSK